MIFATDLDRTLIYSHLFLKEVTCPYKVIESKDNRAISYISQQAISLLKELHDKAHIIPISLRNDEEFRRIDLFREILEPEIYVTNNGGKIYYKGKEDLEWQGFIANQREQMERSFITIREKFLSCYKGQIHKEVNCGNLIWLFMGEYEGIDKQGIDYFRQLYGTRSWRIDCSGRKIYVYPYFVTKWKALEYITTHYYKEPIFAAGDSIFDLEMVEQATYGMIPKASYIELQVKKHVKISQYQGIRAADEILREALKQVKNLRHHPINN